MEQGRSVLEGLHQSGLTYDWAIDLDIKHFFDEIEHKRLIKALERGGTPQGGVISPLLAKLYLHFALDK
jgi:retron-type reverse transcriptase